MTEHVAIICVTTPMSIPLFGNRFHLLVEAGVDLHIVVGEPIIEPIAELPTAATVHVVPMTRSINPIGDLTALVRMVKLQRHLRPKLVAAATPKASLIGLLAARLNRVPVRAWEAWGAKWNGRNGFKNQALLRLDRVVAGSATNVAAVSHSLSQLLVEKQIVKQQPEVIGQGSTKGIDLEKYRPTSISDRRHNLTVGFVGRISNDKGVETLIAVSSLLRETLPGIELLLVGEIDSADPPSDELMRVIDSASWIKKTGWIPNTAPYYAEIDLLLFPSLREGLPNVVLEAASSGIPVVAYDAVGTRDAVISGETGYLAPMHDWHELHKRARTLMLDQDKRLEMGRQGRRFVTECFNAHRVTDLWTHYYLRHLEFQDA